MLCVKRRDSLLLADDTLLPSWLVAMHAQAWIGCHHKALTLLGLDELVAVM
jgi:hypothetical protein